MSDSNLSPKDRDKLTLIRVEIEELQADPDMHISERLLLRRWMEDLADVLGVVRF